MEGLGTGLRTRWGVTRLPHAEHTVGAQTKSYRLNAFTQAFVIHPHTTHRSLPVLSVSWGYLGFGLQGGEKMPQKQSSFVGTNRRNKSCPGVSHTPEAPGRRGRPGGRTPENLMGGPFATHSPQGAKPQSEPQLLPWSNENIYGNDIPSVVKRNKMRERVTKKCDTLMS